MVTHFRFGEGRIRSRRFAVFEYNLDGLLGKAGSEADIVVKLLSL